MFFSHHSIDHLSAIHLCILQVGWAQNHLYDYIFHQIACPPCWFACKNLGPPLKCSCLQMYMIIQNGWGSLYKLSMVFKCNQLVSVTSCDEVSLAPYTVFPLSSDVSDESPQDSQRLVVFYIPRWVFQLNHCNHIGASFKSGDTAVQFELCGIRLVYEQNVRVCASTC